ncbi:MAG: single-stranded DNA-binding protein [Bifidobacteriaceae bacterium]|jgi:single-strand DNA-binding protein|nr:single-stranded DNA-binding protein [Bifidobacteriaceae bacterium]
MAGETVITIVGNVTADPELRTIASGASVVNFTVASTPRTYNRQSGQWEDGDALFMRCSAWRELADHIQASITKGMRVIVTGRLNQRSYQTQQGENRTVVEMQVDEIGPSLRYATAAVTRIPRGQGGQGYNGGNNVYGQNQNNAAPSGYTGGANAPAQGAPAAGQSGSSNGSSEPWASYGNFDSSSGFGTSGTQQGGNDPLGQGPMDEPPF